MRLINTVVDTTTTLALLVLLLSSLTGSALVTTTRLSKLQRQNHVVPVRMGTRTNCFENNPGRSAHVATTSSISFVVSRGRLSDPTSTVGLMRHYAAPNDDNEEDMESMSSGKVDPSSDDENSSPDDPLARINSFLDTPILDPNNNDDQGPVLEALKGFVRDDPELAQTVFSGFFLVAFFVLVRIFNTLING